MQMKNQLLLGLVLGTSILAGCGGGGIEALPTPPVAQTPSNSVNALVAYVQQLIAGTSESTEPVDINGLTLATDDTAEPSAI